MARGFLLGAPVAYLHQFKNKKTVLAFYLSVGYTKKRFRNLEV